MSKAVIKNTLDAFFGVDVIDRTVIMNTEDTEILSDAIDQALTKEKQNENTSKL